MLSEQLISLIEKELKGKKFYYISKYGGYTEGIVEKVWVLQDVEIHRRDRYLTTYTKQVMKVGSTNGVTYNYNEIYFKE